MSPIHTSFTPDAPAAQVKNALNRAFILLTTVIIDPGNEIVDPADLSGLRTGPVVWLLYNRDTAAHTVAIDPGSFKIKSTGAYANPLVGNKPLTANLNPGQFKLLVANIQHDAQFTKYKYTITSDGKPLDPDLDVVDP